MNWEIIPFSGIKSDGKVCKREHANVDAYTLICEWNVVKCCSPDV